MITFTGGKRALFCTNIFFHFLKLKSWIVPNKLTSFSINFNNSLPLSWHQNQISKDIEFIVYNSSLDAYTLSSWRIAYCHETDNKSSAAIIYPFIAKITVQKSAAIFSKFSLPDIYLNVLQLAWSYYETSIIQQVLSQYLSNLTSSISAPSKKFSAIFIG